MRRLASIDVGSNTVRLLAAELSGGRIVRELVNLRATTRLGEGLAPGGPLSERAMERTLSVMEDYAARLKQARVREVSAVATAALREAADSSEFVARVWTRTGIRIEIISGEEEARRTLMGVRAGLEGAAGFPGDAAKLLVDIGGGSTEFVLTTDWEKYKAVSLPMGAVSLHERFLVHDPPGEDELAALTGHCLRTLGFLAGFLPDGAAPELVGTAGSVCTLAAVDLAMTRYDPARITGHRMGRETVSRLLARLSGMSAENRRLVAGVEPGREDIILAGTALLGAVMDVAGAASFTACDWGLREGNLFYLNEKLASGHRAF